VDSAHLTVSVTSKLKSVVQKTNKLQAGINSRKNISFCAVRRYSVVEKVVAITADVIALEWILRVIFCLTFYILLLSRTIN
jgi:hypothetical protein